MSTSSWNIYWNEFASSTYMYGTKLNYKAKDYVEFENKLMPPGTVITEWHSKTNFQAIRQEPSLPLMDGESAYHISVNLEYEKVDDSEVMIRIYYYDRYDAEAENIVLRGADNYFKPPLKAYSYKIQLINAGISKFVFHSLELKEVSKEEFDENAEGTSEDKKNIKKSKKLRKRDKNS